MQGQSKNIFLISFEQETLSSILKCVSDYFYNLNDDKLLTDFYFDEVIENAEAIDNVFTEGLKIPIKSKNSNSVKYLYYYTISKNEIERLQPYINELTTQEKKNLSTSIIFCFNYKNLSNGFRSFESIGAGDDLFLKYKLTEFMLQNSAIRSYTLVFFPQEYKNEKIDWIFQQSVPSDTHVNGTNFSIFFNEYNGHLEQLHHFLKLPTYIIANNKFIPKIPF